MIFTPKFMYWLFAVLKYNPVVKVFILFSEACKYKMSILDKKIVDWSKINCVLSNWYMV